MLTVRDGSAFLAPSAFRSGITNLSNKAMTKTSSQKTAQAQELLQSAGRHAEAVLEGKLTTFLPLLAKFPGYSAANLLLLREQYPNASFLARASYWKRLYGDDPILRPEWAGKGIDLILPAFDGTAIVPRVTRFYDAGQTLRGIPDQDPPEPPSTYDARDTAERSLLQHNQMVSPSEEPELEEDLLEPICDGEEEEAAAARVNQLAHLYFDAEEAPTWAGLMPALATQTILLSYGITPPRLTPNGEDLAALATEEGAMTFLDTLQRKYHAFLQFANF